jgi:hypothetical protein
MSTFEQTRSQFSQQHFTIVEIDLPVVEGACTISGLSGYGTPLSCDQPSNAIRTYKFTDYNAPLLPESGILRIIKSITETTTKLQSGKGLASRGTINISFVDVKGDPNKDAPAVDQNVIDTGTFLAKLAARNIFANKDIRIKNYRVEDDGSVDLLNGAETRYYISDSFESTGKSAWSLKCKDELSRINAGDSVWPIPLEGSIRTDVDSSTTSIPVDANVTYIIGDTIRSGKEFMKVVSVSGIGTGSAILTVNNRGNPIDYTNRLSLTETESHTALDEVYVCEVSDNEKIYDLIERILLDVGIPSSVIPKSDWETEIDLWHPTARINTLWFESKDTNEVLSQILTVFTLDLWFDPVARQIKISATSAWKERSLILTEGSEIDFETVKRKAVETLRTTRAIIVYDKKSLATSDTVENFKRSSLFKRTDLETDDLYGEPKVHRFDFSRILSKDAADVLVQRYVQRYTNPFQYTWLTQERKLNFNVGDIVDLDVSTSIGFSGARDTSTRCQISSIKPVYTKYGRHYNITGLNYAPVFADNSEIAITGSVSDINLFTQYAGAPSSAVTITFIFDAATAGSSSDLIPSIKAGAFPVGSKIIIILANGADLKAKGGNGGQGESIIWDIELGRWFSSSPKNGVSGSIVYDAEGVDTDIYFSGATPSTTYPTADGKIRAPSGGDGGFDATFFKSSPSLATGGNGGNGGDGSSVGLGGIGGTVETPSTSVGGTSGTNGLESGANGFGIAGNNNNATGGLAGSGIVDNGAVVTLFGENATNYINGGGDH